MLSEKSALALLGVVNTVARERGIKPFNSGNLFDDLEEAALTLSGNHRPSGTVPAKLQASASVPNGESELLSAYSATENDPVARATFLARNEGALRELVATGRSNAKPAASVESVLSQYNALTDPADRQRFIAANEADVRFAIANEHSN